MSRYKRSRMKKIAQFSPIKKTETIEGDLHDIVNWLHLGIVLPLESMGEWLKQDNYEKIKEILPGLIFQSQGILHEIKNIQSNIPKSRKHKVGNFSMILENLANLWKKRTGLQDNIKINYPKEFESSELIKESLIAMANEGISNAIKHSGVTTRPETKIDVTIKTKQNRVTLEIRDDGRGVDKVVDGYGIKKIKRIISELNFTGVISTLETITSPGEGFTLKVVVKI